MLLEKKDKIILLTLITIFASMYGAPPIIEYFRHPIEHYNLEDVADFASQKDGQSLLDIVHFRKDEVLVGASYDAIFKTRLVDAKSSLEEEFYSQEMSKKLEIVRAFNRNQQVFSNLGRLIDHDVMHCIGDSSERNVVSELQMMLAHADSKTINTILASRFKANKNDLVTLSKLGSVRKSLERSSNQSPTALSMIKIDSLVGLILDQTKEHLKSTKQIKEFQQTVDRFKVSGGSIKTFSIWRRFGSGSNGVGQYEATLQDNIQRVVVNASPDELPPDLLSRTRVQLVVRSDGEIPIEMSNRYCDYLRTEYLESFTVVDSYQRIKEITDQFAALKEKDSLQYSEIGHLVDEEMRELMSEIDKL